MSILFTCAICGAKIEKSSSGRGKGEPFKDGPYKGRRWCPDCWTLHYDAHQEILGDAASRKLVTDEAAKIRAKRAAGGAGSELIWEEGNNRVYLTIKGTFIIAIEPLPWSTDAEFNPDRIRTFIRAIQAISKSVQGYEDILR